MHTEVQYACRCGPLRVISVRANALDSPSFLFHPHEHKRETKPRKGLAQEIMKPAGNQWIINNLLWF